MWRLALTLVITVPALARAESAVVLVPGESEAHDQARAGVIEALAERGIRLVRAPDGEPCEDAECARAIAERTGADYVLLVSIEDAGVRVRAVRAAGDPHDAVVAIGDPGPAHAAATALERALEGASDDAMGFLMIRSSPPGAAVVIDGERAGETPLRRMLAPGDHQVRVGTRERSVVVRALEETALDVDLEAEESEPRAPHRGPRRSEASPLNWILGGALAIAGVVVLISPLQTLATLDECVELIEDVGCVEKVHFGAQSGVLFAIGIAALIAAVIVDVVAPIRVDVAVGESSALLFVNGSF